MRNCSTESGQGPVRIGTGIIEGAK